MNERFGHKNVSDTRSDNVKTVYPPTNTVCGGYNNMAQLHQVNFVLSYVKHINATLSGQSMSKQFDET